MPSPESPAKRMTTFSSFSRSGNAELGRSEAESDPDLAPFSLGPTPPPSVAVLPHGYAVDTGMFRPSAPSVDVSVTGSTDYCTSLKERATQVHVTTLPRRGQRARSDTRHWLPGTSSVALVTFIGG